ncbi:MAG: hypothetical protein K1Y36_24705 [Blastocatellia bacterium]|nr:hypothetical protein [Blastocatellia bacterium]
MALLFLWVVLFAFDTGQGMQSPNQTPASPVQELSRKKPLSAPPGIPGAMMNRPNLPDASRDVPAELLERIKSNPDCFRVQKVAQVYRDRKGLDPKNVRWSLLDLCPAATDMQARPMIPLEVNGKFEMRPYDVVRTFASKREALAFAKAHGLTQ